MKTGATKGQGTVKKVTPMPKSIYQMKPGKKPEPDNFPAMPRGSSRIGRLKGKKI